MKFEHPRNEHLQVLKDYFKLDTFKHEQWSVIRSIMYDKRDCCIIASTGFGKSLIYQFPAVFMKKLTVVISPLCSLMEDQVLSLKARGIKACFFGSQQNDKSLRMTDHHIIYITPEYFKGRQRELQEVRHKILMFAVDEAHLIDQWSDFRKVFLSLKMIRENFPECPIVALTATATQDVKDTIVKTLKLKEDFLYIRTFLDRPNLEFAIWKKTCGNGYMIDIYPLLKDLKEGSAIVYCISRPMTEEISKAFNRSGLQTRYYHSQMERDDRKEVVKDFRENKLRFVICTIAYGMGIDKGDVRLVAHYGVPKSLEAYYQEAGRAGRDGKPSKCVMFYDNNDFSVVRNFVKENEIKETKKRDYMNELINKVQKFATSKKCRRLEILTYLGTSEEEMKKITIRSNCCDNCKKDLMYNVPQQLIYRGLADDGSYNFAKEARILLQANDTRLMRTEVIKLLMGELPTKINFKWYKLKFFGKGLSRTKDWWNTLVSLLLQNHYFDIRQNCLILQKIARNFLRMKTMEMNLKPSPQMLEWFEKRDDIELFWENGNVATRQKGSGVTDDTKKKDQENKSKLEIIYIDDSEDEDLVNNNRNRSKPEAAISTPGTQKINNSVIPQRDSEVLDDEFNDDEWLKIDELENSFQKLKDQSEIDALNEIDFEQEESLMNLSVQEQQEVEDLKDLDFDNFTQHSQRNSRKRSQDDEWDQAGSSKVLKI